MTRWLPTCIIVPGMLALTATGGAAQPATLEAQLARERVDTLLHTAHGQHVDVMVTQGKHFRCMSFDRRNYFQSCMHKAQPQVLVLEYTRGLVAGLRFLDRAPQNMLLVGLGGGSIPKAVLQHFPQARLDVVEIDPVVVQTARDWFGLQSSDRLHIATVDARVFVRQALNRDQRYDLIMLDAFDNEYVPEHLLTVEFLQQVSRLLTRDGIVAANTFSRGRLRAHEEATWQAVFPHLLRSRRYDNDILYAAHVPMQARVEDRLLDQVTGPWPQLAVVTPSPARPLTDQWSPTNLLRDRHD
ncbi:spermidine synthase [Lampropedia cohaerens]|uniref:spermidine synthase n=1 Tax=Lampropedia cohaerens TaxID=1610491 RepID=UPI00069BDDEE|nr:fused MFS/spermidine synthase [Lampropedia cohaerens]